MARMMMNLLFRSVPFLLAAAALGQSTAVPAGVIRSALGVTRKATPLECWLTTDDLDYNTKKTRVLLVDDHAMVRQGLRSILDGYPNLDIIAEADWVIDLGPEGGVAQDERQYERGQPQEPEDGLREIGPGASREIADAVPRGRHVGERGILGAVADDADEGEEGQEDEQNAGDLDGQSAFLGRGLGAFCVFAASVLSALRVPFFHGGNYSILDGDMYLWYVSPISG